MKMVRNLKVLLKKNNKNKAPKYVLGQEQSVDTTVDSADSEKCRPPPGKKKDLGRERE